MKSATKNYLFAVVTVLIVWGTNVSLAENSSPMIKKAAPTAQGIITAENVTQAGFISPKVQPPTDSNYPASASYFWVGKSAKQNPVNNLVMVSAVTVPPNMHTLFAYGSSQKDFEVDGGTGKEATLVGTRTAINFIKHDTYVVVIGPSPAEVEALASIVAEKIK